MIEVLRREVRERRPRIGGHHDGNAERQRPLGHDHRRAAQDRIRRDLGGVPVGGADQKDPMYGPYLFKKGFGGTLIRFAGAHDAVPRALPYRLYRTLEPLYTKVLQLRARR